MFMAWYYVTLIEIHRRLIYGGSLRYCKSTRMWPMFHVSVIYMIAFILITSRFKLAGNVKYVFISVMNI